MRRSLRRALSLLSLLAACTGTDTTSTVDRLTLVEDFRIGGADTGKASFTAIAALAFDDAGRIWVLDRQAHELRIFSSRGEYLRAVGKQGAGPGEFAETVGFALGGDGLVWIPDHGLHRYSVIDTSGRPIASHPNLVNNWGWVWPGLVDDQGRLQDEIFVRSDTSRRRALRRFRDTSLTAADTFFVRDCSSRPYVGYELKAKNGASYMSVPFTPVQQTASGRDGRIWCSVGASFSAIGRDIVTGDSVAAIRYDRTPLPVPRPARDSAIASIQKQAREMGAEDPDFSLIPATQPAITQILVDDQGRVWLRTPSPAGTTIYDLFDRSGRHLAEITAPVPIEGWSGLAIRGDTMVAVVLDDDDVPTIRRLHLAAAPGAP